MGLWDKFVGWITGRDPKESDVYANYDKVDEVSTQIRTIARKTVGDAQEAIYAAMENLNNVNGMAEYVGTMTVSNYDSVFESITSTVDSIADSLEGKAADIKKYEESPWYTKVASSVSMGLCKVGEGLLSVVEDLGDGVVSLVGWGAGKLGATKFQEDCANFVQKEWSHDAFNFYYNSEFAKASAFTEDSGLAGGFKLVGKVAGYVAAGYATAGALGLGAATVYGSGLLSASGATIGGTVAAAVGGLGSGTEAGLNAGLSYDDAFKLGTQEAVKGAAMAFVGGKIGEKISNVAKGRAAAKAASKLDDVADDGAKLLTEGADEAVEGATKVVTESADEVAGNGVKLLTDGADEAVEGATKVVTESADEVVEGATKVVTESADEVAEGATKAVSESADEVAEGIEEGAKQTIRQRIGEKITDARDALSSAKTKVTDTIREIPSKIKEAPGKMVDFAREYPGKAKEAILANGIPKATAGGVGATLGTATSQKMLDVQVEAMNAQKKEIEGFQQRYGDLAESLNEMDSPFTPSANLTGGNSPGFTLEEPTETVQYPNGGIEAPTGGTTTGGGGGGSTLAPIQTTPNPAPTTVMPTTVDPLPVPPTTAVPTVMPTTAVPTVMPTTAVPTTAMPTTVAPPTYKPVQPTTAVPTVMPTTAVPPTYRPVPPTTSTPTGVVTPINPTSGGGSSSGTAFGGESGIAASLGDFIDDTTNNIDDIIKGSKNKIPTGNKPIKAATSGSSSVIPIAAGLSVASAAGLGAKAYIDRKKNNSTDDSYDEDFDDVYEDDDDFIADGWSEDDADAETLELSDNQEFVNQDKQDDDEYYHMSENPFPIMGTEELEEY